MSDPLESEVIAEEDEKKSSETQEEPDTVPEEIPTGTVSIDKPSLEEQHEDPNPWLVDNVSVFNFYCCPECDFKGKTVPVFKDHATEKHPRAKDLFDKKLVVMKVEPDVRQIKQEIVQDLDDSDEFYEDDNDNDNDEDFKMVDDEFTSDDEKSAASDDSADSDYDPDSKGGSKKRKTRSGRQQFAPPPAKKVRVIDTKTLLRSLKRDVPLSKIKNAAKFVERRTYNKSSVPFRKHRCGSCSMVFDEISQLTTHLKLAHNIGADPKLSTVLVCQICKARLPGRRALEVHMRNVHDPKSKMDPEILKKLREAVRNRPANPKRNFRCDKCDKVIGSSTALNNHMRMVHRKDKDFKPYQCEHEGCEYKTHAPENLKQHIKFKHEKDKHQFKCDECDRTFPYENNLINHKNIVHLGIKKHVCHKCGKSFNEKMKFKEHMELPVCDFMTNKDKIWNCDECEAEFNMLVSYIGHHRKAHKSFPQNLGDDIAAMQIMCDQCSAIFLTEGGLKLHKRNKHSDNPKIVDRNKFKEKCPHCDKIFTKGVNMKEHIATKHDKHTPFKCEKCVKSFGTEQFLRTHVAQVHRRTKCPVCDMSICNTYQLKLHLARVHNVKPDNAFKCDHCFNVFCTEHSLAKHIAKVHPDAPQILIKDVDLKSE